MPIPILIYRKYMYSPYMYYTYIYVVVGTKVLSVSPFNVTHNLISIRFAYKLQGKKIVKPV